MDGILYKTIEKIDKVEMKGFRSSFLFRNRLINEETKNDTKHSSLPRVLSDCDMNHRIKFMPFVCERDHLGKLIDKRRNSITYQNKKNMSSSNLSIKNERTLGFIKKLQVFHQENSVENKDFNIGMNSIVTVNNPSHDFSYFTMNSPTKNSNLLLNNFAFEKPLGESMIKLK